MKKIEREKKTVLFNRLPESYGNSIERCKSILVLTKSALLLSVSKPQNHNKNTERSDMQPAQRLLSCLFCLLSERRESHREGGRERGWETAENPKYFKKTVCIPAYWKDKQGVTLLWWNKRRVFNSEERGMLVLQISDPCPAAKPKQIPFQTAHLQSSSLSPLLSQLKALDIFGEGFG